MSGEALAAAAERFVGVPFRLHGRDPERGLDCIGLALAALETVGRRVRVPAYRLRMREIGGLVAAASDAGLVEASGPVRPGDVLLVRPGPAQHHLAIAASGGGFVHAHAGLRRVVLTPAPLPWAEGRRWRLL
jgi:cell wall-associated NlpC family hydrolase